jgi:hypothetical protein
MDKPIAYYSNDNGETYCPCCVDERWGDNRSGLTELFKGDRSEYRQTCDICDELIWRGMIGLMEILHDDTN